MKGPYLQTKSIHSEELSQKCHPEFPSHLPLPSAREVGNAIYWATCIVTSSQLLGKMKRIQINSMASIPSIVAKPQN